MKRLLILLLFPIFLFGQTIENKKTKIEFGTELELYPVGYMPTITSNVFLKDDLALRFRLGGNFANRKDFSGINDDEVERKFSLSLESFKERNIFGVSVEHDFGKSSDDDFPFLPVGQGIKITGVMDAIKKTFTFPIGCFLFCGQCLDIIGGKCRLFCLFSSPFICLHGSAPSIRTLTSVASVFFGAYASEWASDHALARFQCRDAEV